MVRVNDPLAIHVSAHTAVLHPEPNNKWLAGGDVSIPAAEAASGVVFRRAARSAAASARSMTGPRAAQALSALTSLSTGDLPFGGAGAASLVGALPLPADMSALLTDPSQMEQLLNQGIFEPKATPEQTAALERLETMLALIEGWVQTVVNDALGALRLTIGHDQGHLDGRAWAPPPPGRVGGAAPPAAVPRLAPPCRAAGR